MLPKVYLGQIVRKQRKGKLPTVVESHTNAAVSVVCASVDGEDCGGLPSQVGDSIANPERRRWESRKGERLRQDEGQSSS